MEREFCICGAVNGSWMRESSPSERTLASGFC